MPTDRAETTDTAGQTDDRRTDGVGAEERDGGGSTSAFETYVDDEYGYRLAYPAGWTVETESTGGASFDDPQRSAGSTVSVDDDVNLTLAAYVDAFLDAIVADDHVRALERLDRRDVALEGGRTGRVIEYAYRSEPDTERWRLTYLFALTDGTGYVLGVDWNDDEEIDDLATRIVESFVVETN